MTLMVLVNLYALYRGIAKMSYQIPYSPEAEKLLFHLIVEKKWDLLAARIHPVGLKWLFQQEKISGPLCLQILNFCRSNSPIGTHIIVRGNQNKKIDIQTIAEFIAAGDNFGPKLLVSLLKQLQEEEGQEENITSVVNFMVVIINIFPDASDQLCMHGIGNAIHSLYYYSHEISVTCSLLIFNILHSVKPETLSDNEVWFLLTTKVIGLNLFGPFPEAITRKLIESSI